MAIAVCGRWRFAECRDVCRRRKQIPSRFAIACAGGAMASGAIVSIQHGPFVQNLLRRRQWVFLRGIGGIDAIHHDDNVRKRVIAMLPYFCLIIVVRRTECDAVRPAPAYLRAGYQPQYAGTEAT